jgi:hypothetical protein
VPTDPAANIGLVIKKLQRWFVPSGHVHNSARFPNFLFFAMHDLFVLCSAGDEPTEVC